MPFQVNAQCMLDSVYINALMIDPSGAQFSFDTNGDGEISSDDEFIEICNSSVGSTVDLSGWRLGDDDPPPFPDFTFPDGTFIGPGECLLVVHDLCPEADGLPNAPNSCGSIPGVIDMNSTQTGLLGNSGDVITLVNHDSSASCSVVYGNVNCSDVDPLDSPFYDPNACADWGDDIDGCALLASGDSCNYAPMTLPIELLYLKVEKINNNRVSLLWATASEVLNEKFDIEWRAENTNTFRKIGQVKAVGDSNFEYNYEFIHDNPDAGINYYRLKQIDLNGMFTYSPIRSILLELNDKINIYPTLVETGLRLSGINDNYLVSLIDLSGQTLFEKRRVTNNEFVDLKHLASGYYVFRIFDGTSVVNKIFIKE